MDRLSGKDVDHGKEYFITHALILQIIKILHYGFTTEGSLDGKPLLVEQSEGYKVLWPLDKGLLDNDDALVQTPGY